MRPPRRPGRAIVGRLLRRFLTEPLSVRKAAAVIVTCTTGVVLAGGVLMRLLDPHDFPNVWLSLWWAVQTATTVGYGDVVPRTVAGRVVGTVVMLEGIAFLAIVTAAITSVFVTRAQRELGRSADARWGELEQRLTVLIERLERAEPGPSAGSPPSNDVPPAASGFHPPQGNSSREAMT